MRDTLVLAVSLVLVVIALSQCGVESHPTFYPRDALNPACNRADSPPEIYSYHIHILFWQSNNQSVTNAMNLRSAFMSEFGLVDGTPCDDSNVTHPPTTLCAFEPDYPTPAPPFLTCEWAIFVPPSDYGRTVQWITQRRGNLDLFVHPNSGCEIEDHTLWPLWGGKPWELDVDAFHYDCPGCSMASCRASGEQLLFGAGGPTPAQCGLQPGANGQTPFQLNGEGQFCSGACQNWIQSVIGLPVGCPHNCDLYTGDQQALCQSYMLSLNDFQSWSAEC